MTAYTKATNFLAKDSLPDTDAGKIIKGSEFDTEFNNLQTAVNSKANSLSAALSGTPTAPTATAGTNTTQIATTAFVTTAVNNGFPSGGIIIWSGSSAAIPSGWLLCDGTSSTPDLRNRFVVGATDTYNVGDTGGSADAIVVAHSHTASSSVTDPGHNHSTGVRSPGNTAADGAGDGKCNNGTSGTSTTGISVSTTVNSTGSSGTNANLPPYYALCYIMKS